jgi:hypothetical protein
MPVVEYSGTFADSRGTESIVISNDGHTLTTRIRGVDFSGTDFDDLQPEPGSLASTLFCIQLGSLCACELRWTMPVVLSVEGRRTHAPLRVRLYLGDPLPNGRLSSEHLQLELQTPSGSVQSSGRSGWFEDELLELARKLPPEERLFACITCQFSDYSPLGHGLFGGLACFRDVKQEYVAISDKAGIFSIWDRRTELVQETFLCDQYAPRVPGTGYRG